LPSASAPHQRLMSTAPMTSLTLGASVDSCR
jgi:hypothetical protein